MSLTAKRQFFRALSRMAFGLMGIAFIYMFAFNFSVAAAELYAFKGKGGIMYYTNIPGPGRVKVILPLSEKRVSEESTLPSSELDLVIASASERFSVNSQLIRAIIETESNFNTRAISPKGALGLMQLIPTTAKEMGVANPFDPAQNIYGGVKYLGLLLDAFKGDLSLALAAYNAGPGKVLRHKGIPPIEETRKYVNMVLKKAGFESSHLWGVFRETKGDLEVYKKKR